MSTIHQRKILAIIPARYQSVRFPGKPLVDIQGKPMVQRVYEQVLASETVAEVIVATEDQRVLNTVKAFGGLALLTSDQHASGTDRCGEVAQRLSEYDIILNVQGDEPFIPPAMIDELVHFYVAQPFGIATLARTIQRKERLFNPDIVKVVRGEQNQALYFSRHPIPYQRDLAKEQWLEQGQYLQHVGMYIFDRNSLLEIVQLPEGALEQQERLEQLRWLEHGFSIGVGLTAHTSIGIDRPEDLHNL